MHLSIIPNSRSIHLFNIGIDCWKWGDDESKSIIQTLEFIGDSDESLKKTMIYYLLKQDFLKIGIHSNLFGDQAAIY